MIAFLSWDCENARYFCPSGESVNIPFMSMLSESLCPQPSACLACGFAWAVTLFESEARPLATLGWPTSAQSSCDMPRYPLDFMRCVRCGHIYNRSFAYHQVPYQSHPNLMYNDSQIWQGHLERLAHRLLAFLPEKPVVIEVGCGQGAFLRRLAALCPDGLFIGFDPNLQTGQTQAQSHLRFEACLFEPGKHLPAYRPDLILSRHVLEHLMNPLAFLQETVFFSSYYGLYPYLFFEVPCVDRLLAFGRLEDLYYEHNSHFTRRSFQMMLQSLPCETHFIETGYNGEVIFGLLQLKAMADCQTILAETRHFKQLAEAAQQQVPEQIKALLHEGKTVVLWGGTGKGAAFVHHFSLEPESFPLQVVDSDPLKAGTYVPGTAYLIAHCDVLESQSVDIIIIPAQWRAADIALEIQSRRIAFEQLMIEHQGVLVDFLQSAHPYQSGNA